MSVEEKTEGRNDFSRLVREFFKDHGYDFEPHPSSEEVGEEEKTEVEINWVNEMRKFMEREFSYKSPYTRRCNGGKTSENPLNNEM